MYAAFHNALQPLLSEEYARLDNEKLMSGISGMNKIVYDCMDPSPFYDSSDPYLDESDVIEVSSDD